MEYTSFKNWLIVKNLLEHIEHSALLIQDRTAFISSSDDFILSPSGMEKLDAVCMQLIAIGEAVTKLDNCREGKLRVHEPAIPWGAIKGERNFIAHDYFDIDAEEIFHIIKHDLSPLLEATQRLLKMTMNQGH